MHRVHLTRPRLRRAPAAMAVAAVLLSVPAVGATAQAAPATPAAGLSPRAACAYYSGRPLLVYGDHGAAVSQAQCLLANWRYLPWSGVDGAFGTNTLAAVKKFQGAHGLTKDGKIGPKTWAKLYG
ncbi:peptidoglycan-binding domain-containing protein [Streptomyces sp. NPDC047017]|uniref:peptidoglycan-binding domain-containing protein n=1 Tax=Streptomyces sp. NPDC047017 TaxID=3155024 RepID=UPI0033E0709A